MKRLPLSHWPIGMLPVRGGVGGTRPTDFDRDWNRVIETLEAIAAAHAGGLEPTHGFFREMSVKDWQRWAYRHTDHHLRQFGA